MNSAETLAGIASATALETNRLVAETTGITAQKAMDTVAATIAQQSAVMGGVLSGSISGLTSLAAQNASLQGANN